MTPKWKSRPDAFRIEATIREQAERLGLSPDHVIDLVEVQPIFTPGPLGLHDTDARQIEQAVRRVALERADLRRSDRPLPFSGRELHDHFVSLVAQGRHRDAEAFKAQHRDAIAAAKVHVARETQAALEASQVREERSRQIADKMNVAAHWAKKTKERIDTVERLGVWPETNRPVSKTELEELYTEFARKAEQVDALKREFDAINNAQ